MGRQVLRTLRDLIITALLCALGAWAAQPFDALEGATTLIWFPGGIALAMVAMTGPWSALGAVLGGAVYFPLSVYHLPIEIGLAFGTIDALGALAVTALLRWSGFDYFRARPVGDFARFYLIACVVVPLIKTGLAVAPVWYSTLAPPAGSLDDWSVANVIGESFGALLVGPALMLIWKFRSWSTEFGVSARRADLWLWLAATAITVGLPFVVPGVRIVAEVLGGPFLLFPLVVWAALRFAFPLAVVASSGLVIATALSAKLHVDDGLSTDTLTNLMRLALFMTVLIAQAQLIAAATRERQLSDREGVRLERERGNLLRYFSPNVVELILAKREPLAVATEGQVAVLFCDIVGYSGLVERLRPADILDLLRRFHAVTEQVIHDHGGTLEKFIGDAVLATFGTPYTGPDDAARALAAARAMVVAIGDLSAARVADGQPPIAIGIGLHYGPAVMGDIGSERNMAFIVTGDTVNVTSRLEAMTRTLDATIVASADLIDQVRRERGAEAAVLVDGLTSAGIQPVRGRAQSIAVWRLPRLT